MAQLERKKTIYRRVKYESSSLLINSIPENNFSLSSCDFLRNMHYIYTL